MVRVHKEDPNLGCAHDPFFWYTHVDHRQSRNLNTRSLPLKISQSLPRSEGTCLDMPRAITTFSELLQAQARKRRHMSRHAAWRHDTYRLRWRTEVALCWPVLEATGTKCSHMPSHASWRHDTYFLLPTPATTFAFLCSSTASHGQEVDTPVSTCRMAS